MSAELATHNVDAERQVCGAVLLSEPALERTRSIDLQLEDFYFKKHGLLYAAALALDAAGKPVDEITVKAELDRAGDLAAVGGQNAVSELAATVARGTGQRPTPRTDRQGRRTATRHGRVHRAGIERREVGRGS
jgi:replicative DNA helicase